MKKLGKDGLSEDLVRDTESSIQNLTDKYISNTDKISYRERKRCNDNLNPKNYPKGFFESLFYF